MKPNSNSLTVWPGLCSLCGKRYGDHKYNPGPMECPFKPLPGGLERPVRCSTEEEARSLAQSLEQPTA